MSVNKKVEIRELQLLGRSSFPGRGSDLRRSVTALFTDNTLFHNHNPDGSFSYSTPKVRYLVDQGTAKLVSLLAGNQELDRLYEYFENASLTLDVRGKPFLVEEVVLVSRAANVGTADHPVQYHSISPWLGLNSENSQKFNRMTPVKKKELLSKLFTANALSLAKNLDLWIPERIVSRVLDFEELPVNSGQMGMLGLRCTVETNFVFDRILGLGKLVSKGFGRFQKITDPQNIADSQYA